MKRILLVASLIVGIGSVQADEYQYPYLVLQTSDGSSKALSVESLTLTVSDGQLIATNSAGTQTFTLSELSSMRFSESATAVTEIEVETAEETVEVFSLAGVAMGSYDNLQSAEQALPAGIYIVKSNQKTSKIALK